MLGVYLVNHGLLKPKDGRVVFRGRQGSGCAAPASSKSKSNRSGNVAQSVRIVGDAVIVYEAEVQV